MLLTSLRYCDAMRSGTPKKTGQAFDGVARKGKMLAQPMLWYCPRKDFSGSCLWSETWMEQLSLLGRDHLFPDFVGGCISDATAWSAGSGPPSKHKVYGSLIHMLGQPPLSMSAADAKQFVKLHGMRRVVPILTRLFSSVLGLTVEDRNEIGRWAYTKEGGMPNLYSDEANRPRQIEVREKVLDRARVIFSKFKDDYQGLELKDSYSMCYGDSTMAFADPEPGLDEFELLAEKYEGDDESDDESPPQPKGIPEGYTTQERVSRSGKTYKVYFSPDGSNAGRSVPDARRHFDKKGA